MPVLPPLSLYIHLPWCVRKCPYCDFNSHALRGELPEQAYVEALLRDLDSEVVHTGDRRIETIFIGGGTPSLFSPAAIERLLAGIRERAGVARDCEITLEANPGTVDVQRFAAFREAGVNRLSIGIQSFEEEKLKALGRIHGRGEALAAARAAREAGFDNFNLDLMFGLPGQTPGQALADIEQAIALGSAHLSAYQLTLEPNTLFHAQPPELPDEDSLFDMQEIIEQALASAGYEHYEVSAHALPGRHCRHNLNYWQFGDYLGIGAGAHGKRTTGSGITRNWKLKQPQAWMSAAGGPAALGGERQLTADDTLFEFALNALRLREGFTLSLFEERTGLPRAALDEVLEKAARGELVERTEGRVCASARGARLLNDLLLLFLPESGHRHNLPGS